MAHHASRTSWIIALTFGANVTLATGTTASAGEVFDPGAKTPAVALVRVNIEQATAELELLNRAGIRTLADMAAARRAVVANVVGDQRAGELIASAQLATGSNSITDPTFAINPPFVADPAFLIDPKLRTDSTTVSRIRAAQVELASLNAIGVRTLGHMASPAMFTKLKMIVGTPRANAMAASATGAITWTGITDPTFAIDAPFLVDPRIINTPGD